MKLICRKLGFFLLLFLLFLNKFSAQTCGGSFGAPIFMEDFGSVTTPLQMISPALVPPAFTNYVYSPKIPPDDGYYTITNSTEYLSWGWQKSLDHTNDAPGTYGNMLLVNASYTPGEFYRRRVSNLCSNQVYRFSAWILNIHRVGANVIKPNVTFQIRSTSGVILGSVSTGDLIEENGEFWRNFYLDFKSDPTSSDVDVVLINNAPGGMGNDLAIDDISFSPCGPATSVSTSIDVFTTGVCDNSLGFQLKAQISAGTYTTPNYIWQKSTDGGNTWVDLTLATTNPVINISAGSYQNNDLYRFIVGESTNISSPTCRVYSSNNKAIVLGYPAAPSPKIFNFCHNSTGNSIAISGKEILWYTTSTGGIPDTLPPTVDTSVVGSKDYWVTETVNGCESSRTKITVNIIPIPTVPLVTNYQYCQNSTANQLTANGTNLLWYSSATGGTGSSSAPIPTTSQLGVTSFWVSQNNGTCESARAEIKVTVLANPNAPQVSDIQYCHNASATPLTAAGTNLLWYTSSTGGIGTAIAPTPNTSQVGGFSFWVSQSVNGCESPRAKITVTVFPIPTAPQVADVQFCQNSTASALVATGSNLLWYTSQTGGTGSSNAPIPSTTQIGDFYYWVSQNINGCESPRAPIKVSVLANPNPPLVANYQYCQNYTASALSATGTNLLWYSSATGGAGTSVAPIPSTTQAGNFSFWVSQSNGNCESARAEIVVTVLPAPHSDVLENKSICDGGTVTLDAGGGFSAYEWNTIPIQSSRQIIVTSAGKYTVKLTGSNGCTAFQTVEVTNGVTPNIINIKSGENFLEISAEGGNPPYFYSLDNVNWQTSNIFTNLKAGIYQIFVKSQTNSCTAVAQSAVLFIPNVITPNQDSFNDVWKVGNIEYFKNAKLAIYDRYGKKVFYTEDISKFNWDGFYLGRVLPSDTYWYVIEIQNNYTRTGWILLKTRN